MGGTSAYSPEESGLTRVTSGSPLQTLLQMKLLRSQFVTLNLQCSADDFPDSTHMFFGGEDVAQAEAHDGAALQFGLHEVGFAGGVDGLDELGVLAVGGGVVGRGFYPEADDAHDGGGG